MADEASTVAQAGVIEAAMNAAVTLAADTHTVTPVAASTVVARSAVAAASTERQRFMVEVSMVAAAIMAADAGNGNLLRPEA